MAYAALLSGICLANAGLGAVHGLASPLGALLPIPHGMACGAVLWQTNEANVAALAERGRGTPGWVRHAEAGRLLAGLPADTPDDDACGALVTTLRSWTRELGIPGLAGYGMRGTDIPLVRDGARGNLRTNPVALGDAELDAILEASL
jgi:alcohol dehydrogenase